MDEARWEADVVTADGHTVRIRPIGPDDRDRLVAFHGRQSPESIYLRYFSPRPRLTDAEVEHLVNVDGHDRMAFVALLGDELIGVARYDGRADRPDAEVAFFVDDDHKGRGLGTILLEYLAAWARECGITTFIAEVLPGNRRMLSVFRQAGFEARSTYADGVVDVSLDIVPTEQAMAAMEERARRSEARSVARLLEPRSVAVIGAGREPGSVGHEILRQLLRHRFRGPVHAVNRDATHVGGVPAYRSVLDVPDQIDVAVIAVPASEVLDVVDECGRARVGGLVVITAGLDEGGADGVGDRTGTREVVERTRRHGLRLIGPNSMGVVNTDSDVRLHATFFDVDPLPGHVALSSQSGTLGAAVLERARLVGLGVSSFVSLGSKADVSGNDLLRYWEDDPRTAVMLLHLESFGNPRRFSRVARRVSRHKPIVAVLTGADLSARSLLAQTGVVRVETLTELVDVARVLSTQPVPPGPRVALVGNSGGLVRLAAGACRGVGLVLAELESSTAKAIEACGPDGSRVENPVDLTHLAGPAEYAEVLRLLLADVGVDTVLVLYAPPIADRTAEVVRSVSEAVAGRPDKPVVASFFAGATAPMFDVGDGRMIPNFEFPDEAARALGRAAAYGAWRSEPEGAIPDLPDVDLDGARSLIVAALTGGGTGELDPEQAAALMRFGGMAVVDQRVVGSAAEAAAAAAAIGYPVALKAARLDRRSKTEAGGLALDLHDADELARSFQGMSLALGDSVTPAIVQAMADPGTDLRLSIRHDPLVGPVVGVGAGGAEWRALGDGAVRIVPLTDIEASRLLEESGVASWLEPGGREAAADALVRLAHLAAELPELVEAVLNPLIVTETKAWATDVRVRVARYEPGPPPVRRL